MTYKFRAIPTIYNHIQYRSRLEARWAAFFDLMNWKFTYEPFDLKTWSPDFKLTTAAGTNFLVEVKPNELNNTTLRLRIGEASNFSNNILLINESPFTYPYPNCLGLTSIFGKTKNHKEEDDFEFCTSVIANLYNKGTDIFNLCEFNEDIHQNLDSATEFCLALWAEAGNKVMFLKPKK